MDVEIKDIEKNGTWQLTSLPIGAKKVGVKWVYKTKANENGEIKKYKAYLVAKCYAQKHDIYYTETSGGIFIYQKKYAEEMLERFDMDKYNSVDNPIVSSCKLTRDKNGTRVDNKRYKQLIGNLMYLTTTRLDMMYVVSLLSKYMEHPIELHFQAAKKVLNTYNDQTTKA
ncbi:hypothetical protein CR513_59753, partial [Mucuna pruriens]